MRWLRHSDNGRSQGDRLNWGQRKIRFRLAWWGSDWRIKVPNRNPNGQIREREDGHDRCLIDAWWRD